MKKTIFIDMDNTINKFWIPYITYYNKMFGKNVSTDPSIMVDYSLSICLGIEKGTPEEDAIDTATMCNHTFWTDDMPVYEEAPEVLERLCERYNVYILSTPYAGYDNCIAVKMQWMSVHFPFFPKKNMIFTWHKELLRGDMLIDDKPENLEKFDGQVATISYPYNMKVTRAFHGKNWYELEKHINNVFANEEDIERKYETFL